MPESAAEAQATNICRISAGGPTLGEALTTAAGQTAQQLETPWSGACECVAESKFGTAVSGDEFSLVE